jgi:dihydrolipoamide dehydrogenase
MKKYNLVVVGSGAGLMVLEAALQQGLKCAIVERSKFGGTCLTKGCIPSKMLVYPADLIREAQEASRVGLTFRPPEADWATVARRMWGQIGHSEGIRKSLKEAPDLDVYEGTAEFTGPKRMRVVYADGAVSEEFTSDGILLAVGARSFVPEVEGLEQAGYVTYERFFGDSFPDKPWKSLILVGGGTIGAEFAHIFSAFGTKVTLVEMQNRILPLEEEEVSSFVRARFEKNGIAVRTGFKAVAAAKDGELKTLVIEDGTGARETISAEEIFVASGVRSNADLLKVELAGVATDARGWIIANEYLETSQKGVYALGDINGRFQFRHKANYEAGILMGNLLGGEKKAVSYDAVPWAVFTWPQVAHVGLTEREAREKGMEIGVARNRYSSVAAGIAMGYEAGAEDDGFVKILLTPDMRIVGAHVAGPYAAMLVQPFVYLIHAGCPCQALGANVLSSARAKFHAQCPELGSVMPVADSMVIHPSMNELPAWAIDNVEWD